MFEFGLQIGNGLETGHPRRRLVPINFNGVDGFQTGDQTLVEQIAQDQQFRMRAQGHEGDDFAPVQEQSQGALSGDHALTRPAEFVDGDDFVRRAQTSVGEAGSIRIVSHRYGSCGGTERFANAGRSHGLWV